MQTLTARPKNSQIIPIEDFLGLSEKEKSNIRRVKILAPDMDGDNFGCIQVFYNIPLYHVELDNDCETE